jgi:Protein of unknown function (DUF2793)
MPASPNLSLPFLEAAQAQKHVTHNEALSVLDAVVHLSVLDRDLAVPPPAPQEGDRYLVSRAASLPFRIAPGASWRRALAGSRGSPMKPPRSPMTALCGVR